MRELFPSEYLRRWQWWVAIPAVLLVSLPWMVTGVFRATAYWLDIFADNALEAFEGSALHKVIQRLIQFGTGEEVR